MKRPADQRPRQVTTQEVLDGLLGLVRRKFYDGEAVQFAKDRRNILQWALLWPARSWFDPKGLSVAPERYQELLAKIIVEAAAFQAQKIKYRPAYLRQVVQSHFAVHGDELYEEAKAVRTLAQNALATLGKLPPAPDRLVTDLATPSRLLDASKRAPKSASKKPRVEGQLNLI